MPKPKTERKIVLVAAALLVFLAFGTWRASDALIRITHDLKFGKKPDVMLWAWEAPSDLRWANPKRIGVAYLASTITLYDDRIWVKPRMQPIKVSEDSYLTSVIRLECRRDRPPCLSEKQIDRVVAEVLKQAELKNVKAVQIDFDARVSERPFYRDLLSRIHRLLPADKELSITALASWCIGDRWLRDIPCDEVVPMFFSMGADHANVVQYLRAGRPVHGFDRQRAVGLAENSTDVIRALTLGHGLEAISGQRVYLFSNKGWTQVEVERLLRRVGKI